MEFVAERLVLARKRRRLTLAALAREAGVSAQRITAYENGRANPSPETLESLALVLRFPVSFFGVAAPQELPLAAISFRAPSKTPAGERDSAQAAGRIAAEFDRWLLTRFRLPEPDVPTYPHLPAEDAAERLRARWGLGEAPAPNMVHLLEAHGVRVFSLPSDCLRMDAFATTHPGTPIMFLNTRKSCERGRFDAAHELGHLVLHCEHRIPAGRDAENEANAFASAFLMPRAGIAAQQLRGATLDRVLSAKRKWGVSAMALTYRLHQLGHLLDWQYRQIAKQLSQMGYRTAEPDSTLARESSQLFAKVFEALRGQGTTPADVADQLHLTHDELDEYVFGLIPVGLSGGGQTSPSARPDLRLVRPS